MKTAAILIAYLLALQTSLGNAVLTPCVVQAFGSGLGGKGIYVTVRDNGFGCTGVWPWEDVSGEKDFDGTGEAEVPLLLHVNAFGVCMTEMSVWVTLPYQCSSYDRLVTDADWDGPFGGQGSCRALEQDCGGTVSTAALPYIDMWCLTPIGMIFEGQAQEMRMTWAFPSANDNC